MQGNIKNSVLLRLVAFFAAFFAMYTFSMIQSPSQREMGRKAIKAYMQPKKQPEQQISEKQQQKELEEAFMSDAELEERRKLETTQKAYKRIMAQKEKRLEPQLKEWPPKSGSERKELEEAFLSEEELREKRRSEFIQQRDRLLQQEREKKYPDKYFIYINDHPNEGVLVDKKVVINTSKSLKNMIEDLGGNISAIPIPSSVYIIKLAFDILEEYNDLSAKQVKEISLEQLSKEININYLSLQDLIDVANLFNFLDVPTKVFDLVLTKIKSDVVDKIDDKNINEQLKQLHPDLQKALMLNSTIDYLKDFIIKKYAKNRGKSLVRHPWDVRPAEFGSEDDVRAVAFSPDGKYIVSGYDKHQDNLILWNISNSDNINHKVLDGHQYGVRAVVFNPDGKSFVSGGVDSLILWGINDLNTHQVLMGNASISSLAFSSNGKSLIVGCYDDQDNLILISDINNPTFRLLPGHPKSVISVAFSPDGTKIVSVCQGDEDNLIVWDITDIDRPSKQVIQIDIGDKSVGLVAFSPNGKSFVSAGRGDNNQFILWNISNFPDIQGNVFLSKLGRINKGHFVVENADYINAMVFSHDGKKIALGLDNGFVILDINDPNNRVIVAINRLVLSLAFSPDDKQIVTGGRQGLFVGNNLILWTLLTDEEEILLNQLKNYNADQIRLIYTFCLKALKGEKISLKLGSEEQDIFTTLPEDMQKLLKDLFFSQGWFFGWR